MNVGMRALVLSDIHGNLEALDAVLDAAEGLYDQVWNLGDVVGYGASPNAVCDRLRPLTALNVRGNHDRVCCGLTSPNGFNPVARTAAIWTRNQLTESNLTWLRTMPQGPVHPAVDGVTCAHGSPVHEDHYILTMRDAWAPLQSSPRDLTFFGHTHIQGGFAQKGHEWNDLRPAYERNLEARAGAQQWTLTLDKESRYLMNPGSVGQPRDHDWRAAYAVYDSDAGEIIFHRVPYDVQSSEGRILLAELPERLAVRLREGR